MERHSKVGRREFLGLAPALLLAVMETKPVEFTAGPAADALVFWRGIFNCRVTLPESEMLWSAARLTSTVAPPVAVFAVRKP